MANDLIVWRKFYIRPGKPPKQQRTICEVLRDLHRRAHDNNDELSKRWIEEAHDMAKRMDAKLREYKAPYITSKRK